MPGHQNARASAGTLAAFVITYSLMHHTGLLGSFGAAEVVDGSRLADWIDLATPLLVLGPLLGFCWLQRATLATWTLVAIGSIVYTEGHGIHLAANSISNAAADRGSASPPLAQPTIHLWDEVVGHYLWYGGLVIVITGCALAARDQRIGATPWLALGGAVVGITWATNGLEGGTALFSLALAVLATVPVLSSRRGLAVPLAAGGLVAIAILASYGVIHSGFPQPSSL